MRGRTGRFNEDEQVRPKSSLDSKLLARLTKHSSCLRHSSSSWPCAKELYDSFHAGSLVLAGHSLLSSSECACEQFQLRIDRWTCSSSYPAIRRLPSLARSPSRSCLHLVLVVLKLSFGIMVQQRFLSRPGDWSNVDGTPITQCP
jgi:hypothetical protein